MSRKHKESPASYRARKEQENAWDGFWEGFGGVLGAVATGLAASAKVAELSERSALRRELEQEEELAKVRVIERMAANFPSGGFETRETMKTRYLVERLNDLNKQLAKETSYFKKSMLQEEKERLEEELGID